MQNFIQIIKVQFFSVQTKTKKLFSNKKNKGGDNYDSACKYIQQKYIKLNKASHKIYPHFTCAISTENIEFVFRTCREQVLNKIVNEAFLLE